MILFSLFTIFSCATSLGERLRARRQPDTSSKPHMFTIVLDDLGWTDLGALGAEYSTPFLDQLITEDSVFLNKYYVNPTCSPSRSSFMTGKYPFHLGLQSVTTIPPCTDQKLPLETPTIAESLRANGYQTHAFGKWHLGYLQMKYTPTGRGFDTFSGIFQGGGDYYSHDICATVGDNEWCGYDWWQNDEIDYSVRDEYTNDVILRKSLEMVENYQPGDKPLFGYISYQIIHAPIDPPPKNFTECDNVTFDRRQVYCNKLNYLDQNLKQFVDALKAKGIWEESLIVITTDNGGMPNGALPGTLTDGAGYNFPLRAGKTTVFEGGVRGVAFITGGLLPEELKGTKTEQLFHAIDIVGGQRAMVGLSNDEIDGLSLFETVFEGKSGHEHVFLDVHRTGDFPGGQSSGIRKGAWKYVEIGSFSIYDGWWVNVTGPPELAEDDCSEGCLFNLEEDPSETRNLISEEYSKALELQILLNQARLDRNGYVDQQSFVPKLGCVAKTIREDAWVPMDYRV